MTEKKKWYRGKVADMLRASGYIPAPRVWLTKEQLIAVKAMAKQNENHVNAVRRYCRELEQKEKLDSASGSDVQGTGSDKETDHDF